jgi:hypothetical protein
VPSAHAVPDPQPPPACDAASDRQPPPACEAAPGELLPLPLVVDERRLWNQSDVAEAAAGAVSGTPAARAGRREPNWPPSHLNERVSRSVTLSGSQIIAVRPCGDRACSRTRTPCRSARRPTANSPMCRDTETSRTGGLSSRQLISASRASGMPTPLSLTSISTPPVVSSLAETCTAVCLAEKIVAFSMISASR